MGQEIWAYVLYNVPGAPIWHQRRVLGVLAGSASEYVILTPDLEVYLENLKDANEDIAAVRFHHLRWPPPPGIDRAQVYRLNVEPTRAQMTRARTQGEAAALARFREVGVAAGRAADIPPGGVLVAVDGAGVAAVADPGASVVGGAAVAAGAPPGSACLRSRPALRRRWRRPCGPPWSQLRLLPLVQLRRRQGWTAIAWSGS